MQFRLSAQEAGQVPRVRRQGNGLIGSSDAVNIERVFEALLLLAGELDEEQRRAVREGLTEATQALFDLLMKPDLDKADIKRLKEVAVGLYETLQAQIDAMQDFAAKQATRDQIRVTIRNYLWDEKKGPSGQLRGARN
jgi:type I restriction enzyme R subunit